MEGLVLCRFERQKRKEEKKERTRRKRERKTVIPVPQVSDHLLFDFLWEKFYGD